MTEVSLFLFFFMRHCVLTGFCRRLALIRRSIRTPTLSLVRFCATKFQLHASTRMTNALLSGAMFALIVCFLSTLRLVIVL
jgi:hypothetical protein